jgi:Fur family transcriptional regulator, ferric uptake regulator
MKSQDKDSLQSVLKRNGFRVTQGRLELLTIIHDHNGPLSVKDIECSLTSDLDRVTLYRALNDFTSSKIIRTVHIGGKSVHYEFIHEDDDHHHIVCEICGMIEEIEIGEHDSLQIKALKRSQYFTTIDSHSLEFFGRCTTCIK